MYRRKLVAALATFGLAAGTLLGVATPALADEVAVEPAIVQEVAAPVEEVVAEAPVVEAPVVAAPVVEAPVAEAPAEEAPVEEAVAKTEPAPVETKSQSTTAKPTTLGATSGGKDKDKDKDQVCPKYGEEDHLNPPNGTTKSLVYTAPPGYVIVEYCVKAGSTQQGNGPEIVEVDPPKEKVTIKHPSGKDISHYSVKLKKLAKAWLKIKDPTCESPAKISFAKSYIKNATWGTDTDPDPLKYSITATANHGAIFINGKKTIVFTGTLAPQLPADHKDCKDDEPLVATASLAFTDPTCESPEAIDIAGSAIENATWGADTDPSELGYEITATAVDGAEFAGGSSTKVFMGTLDAQLPADHPDCMDDEPLVATASLAFTDPTCESPQTIDIASSAIANATWGADTDPSELGYEITATAVDGAEFAGGDTTLTFSGTLEPQLAADHPDCVVVEPVLATASLAFIAPTCDSPESIDFAGSAISNATWGPDTDPSELGYEVTATAVAGAEFEGGDTTLTFIGTLDAQLPADSPECDFPTLNFVMPMVTSTALTCEADGSYTLGVADGYNPAHVTFTVNGTPGVTAGTYPVTSAQVVTITAQAVAPNALEPEWQNPEPLSFSVPAGDCDTPDGPPPFEPPTLALTGGGTGSALPIALGFLFAGVVALYLRRREPVKFE